jgi:PST family polysaccharide transporter
MSAEKSYGQILKSTTIMGGAAGIVFLLGVIRTKFAAVLIGAGGVGLMAGFTAIQGLIGSVAGLGIQSSAVRAIAVSVGKADEQAISCTVRTLRRICWLTGLVGMLAMMAFSPLLSRLTFDSDAYTLDIAAIGIIILLVNLTGGQLALLQGMRRIGDMARANIGGAVFSTLTATGFYYWLGMRGIVPSLISIAVIQLAIAWYFARRISVLSFPITWGRTFLEAKEMVRLGLIFMWSGLMVSAVSYFTITLITREIDLHAVGLYSAAFLLSGMSVNFVLGAMGADFYPRLVAVHNDDAAVNRLVNEQTEIGLLLATPALVATLVLAPWIVHVFYTPEFLPAADLMQVFVLGCLGRAVSWPLGILMIARGKGAIYGIAETFWNITHAALIFFGLKYIGLPGVPIAFVILYLIVTFHALYIGKTLSKFQWSSLSKQTILFASVALSLAFLSVRQLPESEGLIAGGLILLATAIFCLRALSQLAFETRLTKILKSIPLLKLLATKR